MSNIDKDEGELSAMIATSYLRTGNVGGDVK
jgi:hypothetical protein